jgi:GPH family glycoside/pentoside/hexuronide:cation symporter
MEITAEKEGVRAQASEPRRLPPGSVGPLKWKDCMLLGLGGFSLFFGSMTIQSMAIPVYQMLLGVTPVMLGLAMTIPRLWDAFLDPVVGRLSDNFRSKWGRRRPFIVLGAISMGISYGLIWMVSPDWTEGQKVAYFIATALLFYTCDTFFAIPYQSLMYESTPDYHERTKVTGSYAFWGKVADLSSGWIFPLSQIALFSSPIVGIRWVGWGVGIFVLGLIGMIPGIFGKERYYHAAVTQAKVSLKAALGAALRNKALIILMALCLLKVMPSMLASSMDHYLLVYYMNGGDIALGSSWKAALTTAYGVVGILSIPVLQGLARKFGKREAMAAVYGLVILAGFGKWFLFVPGHTWIVLLDAVLSAPIWIGLSMLIPSMLADVCDDDELKSGFRREGTFGAIYNWIVKLGVTFAFLGTGLMLELVGFDSKQGAAQSSDTFFWMRFSFAGVTVVSAILGVFVSLLYPISRERSAETRRLLEERRGLV